MLPMLVLRKLWLLLTSKLRSRIKSVDQGIEHTFRVLPFDLDENIHMNNARYLNYMELGRYDWMFRSGFFRYALSKKLISVVANTSIVYLRELGPFQKFKLTTRVSYWNERTAFFEHRFVSRGKTCSIALVEARLVSKDEKIRLDEIARELGLDSSSALESSTAVVEEHRSLVKSLVNEARSS